jgi:hypothetical protein
VNPLLSPIDVQTKNVGQHPDENRSKAEVAIPDGGGSARHFQPFRRGRSVPSWVGGAS